MTNHDSAAGRRARLLRGGPPTEPMPMLDLLRRTPYRNALIPTEAAQDEKVREALDLAARVGELMLRCGAGAPQVEGSVAAVAAAAGLTTLEVDITLQSLLIQTEASSGVTQTRLRVVRSTRSDHARLVAIHELVDGFVTGEMDTAEAAEQLRQIKSRPRVWPTWMVLTASAVLASAVSLTIGASAFAAGLTLVVGILIGLVQRKAGTWRLPEFYSNAIASFVATWFAWGAYVLGAIGALPVRESDFAFIFAVGIVALLPGRTLASAVEDVLSGYAVTGAGRLLAVMISLIGLIIGVAAGLGMTLELTSLMGVNFVSPAVLALRPSQSAWPIMLMGAAIVGSAGTITLQSRRRLIAPIAALAVVGAGVYAVCVRLLDVGPITATGLAAVILGLAGRATAHRLHAPSMVVIVPSTFALLPGLTIFRGLYEMVGQTSPGGLAIQSGITTLLGAAAVLLAIATGTTFGEILASPWDQGFRNRTTRRLRG